MDNAAVSKAFTILNSGPLLETRRVDGELRDVCQICGYVGLDDFHADTCPVSIVEAAYCAMRAEVERLTTELATLKAQRDMAKENE